MSAVSLETLALTALWSAAARAYESRRRDKLFDDPWALLLAGSPAVEAYARSLSQFGWEIADLSAIITRYFDDFLLRAAVEDGIQQVIILGTGLDARGFRLAWPAGTHLYELDQPGLIAYKDRRLAATGTAPACMRHTIGVNLCEHWQTALSDAGFDSSQPSIWLLEGFLYFLAESAVRNLLAGMAELSAPSSCIGIEFVSRKTLRARSTRHWCERMSAVGAPWLFTSDRPELLLAEFGWSAHVTKAGEEAACFGRSFGPVNQHEECDLPQCFLVTGTRTAWQRSESLTGQPAN
jgi:methyltransferase (TIGR00027 family)